MVRGIRKELAETVYLNEALGAPSQRAAAKLFAAIDAEDAQTGGRRRQRLDPPPSLMIPLAWHQHAGNERPESFERLYSDAQCGCDRSLQPGRRRHEDHRAAKLQ